MYNLPLPRKIVTYLPEKSKTFHPLNLEGYNLPLKSYELPQRPHELSQKYQAGLPLTFQLGLPQRSYTLPQKHQLGLPQRSYQAEKYPLGLPQRSYQAEKYTLGLPQRSYQPNLPQKQLYLPQKPKLPSLDKWLQIDKTSILKPLLSLSPLSYPLTTLSNHPLSTLLDSSTAKINSFDLLLPSEKSSTQIASPISNRTRGTKRRNYDAIDEDYDDTDTSYFNSSQVISSKNILSSLPLKEILNGLKLDSAKITKESYTDIKIDDEKVLDKENNNNFNQELIFNGNQNSTGALFKEEIVINNFKSRNIDLHFVDKGVFTGFGGKFNGNSIYNDNANLESNTANVNVNEDFDHDDCDDEHQDSDHLACHAHNILRMAVDSTMLGSTFNSSFSSVNDSLYGRRDFLDEDLDKSILEIKAKQTNLLQKNKAKRIEINADDLENVLR